MTERAGVPADAYSAHGHFSQFLLVIPSRSVVIVHRAKEKIDPDSIMALIMDDIGR